MCLGGASKPYEIAQLYRVEKFGGEAVMVPAVGSKYRWQDLTKDCEEPLAVELHRRACGDEEDLLS